MIHRVLRIGDWVVDFVFVVKKYDEEAILAFMYEFDASYSVMIRAKHIMESNELNRAFTFANPEIKRALIVIGPTSSGDEFANSISHEIHHLAVVIAKSIGYDLDGESPAYLAGDTTMALIKTICELGCNKCNHNNIQ